MSEEFRALVRQIGFGGGKPLLLVGHDIGTPPALLWAADHPEEVSGLLYVKAPVMLSAVLTRIIAYTPEAMKEGSMWWWILPLRQASPSDSSSAVNESFSLGFTTKRWPTATPSRQKMWLRYCAASRREGVLGAMGVYRAAFTSIEQTEPLAGLLTGHQVKVPVVALGGEKGLGEKVLMMVKMVAKHAEGGVVPNCGHFLPEECPEIVVSQIQTLTGKIR